MNQFLCRYAQKALHLTPDLVHSKLYDDTTFYHQFSSDLKQSKQEVIIESPFITCQRVYTLTPIFQKLIDRKVKVYVITRNPNEHDISMQRQAESVIRTFETMGVQVLIPLDFSHRKLAIIDRAILWEGSLNILSQTYSREIMRRIESEEQAQEMLKFTRIERFVY